MNSGLLLTGTISMCTNYLSSVRLMHLKLASYYKLSLVTSLWWLLNLPSEGNSVQVLWSWNLGISVAGSLDLHYNWCQEWDAKMSKRGLANSRSWRSTWRNSSYSGTSITSITSEHVQTIFSMSLIGVCKKFCLGDKTSSGLAEFDNS